MIDTPLMRPVEAFPVEHQGEQMVAIRDPAGYTPSVLLLSPAVVELLALFDGRHSVVDIQAEIVRRHGDIVPRADIERVIEMLDEHGFMDSERFAALRAELDRQYLAAPRRPPTHAAGAYPADPDELRMTMARFFEPPEGAGAPATQPTAAARVRALIAPHIDFHRGGPAYTWAYRDLADTEPDVFVIFGTCHAGMRDPFALTHKDYDTPLGPALVDHDLVDAIAARSRQDCFGSELSHRAEHSIEFQAVFLRFLWGGRRDFTIVPILASFAHEALLRGAGPEHDARVGRFLDAVAETIAASRRRVVVIAGADLAHVGPRFGDPDPVSEARRAAIEREDRAMLAAATDGGARAFFESVARDRDRRRICGLSPIYAALRVLAGDGRAQGTVKRYAQCPDPQGLVSFASVVFP